MFHTLDSFLQAWQFESTSTQRILDALTDESLQQEVSKQDRTLGRIAWHIVTTIHEMMSKTGLQFEPVGDEHQVPASAKTIADSFRQASSAFVKAIREQWTDSTLMEERDMYGERWTNSFTLNMLIAHMIHHRGQMTVLMRQAGLRVPGIYGPSREEWSEMGMEAPIV
jgi:uncharacterized damage-inducible protein DinB